MNKIIYKILALLILFIIFINGFSASYTSHNMTNLAYVLALGIDVGENAKLKITAQFSKTAVFASGSSGTSGEDSSNIVLVSGEADSIYSGLNLLNSYIGKQINLAHCNLVVFSEELAKQRNIFTHI